MIARIPFTMTYTGMANLHDAKTMFDIRNMMKLIKDTILNNMSALLGSAENPIVANNVPKAIRKPPIATASLVLS